jgi:cell division protein FtsA
LRTGVIDVGGDHVTNDLAMALRIPWENAERIKLDQGKAIVKEDEEDQEVWMRGDLSIGDRKLSRNSIHRIVHARLEETLQLVRHDVAPVIEEFKMKCSVVLTGGASRMTGMETLAQQVLRLPARFGRNPDWVNGPLQRPDMSTVVGLLQFAFSDISSDLPEQPRQRSFFSRFSGLIH